LNLKDHNRKVEADSCFKKKREDGEGDGMVKTRG